MAAMPEGRATGYVAATAGAGTGESAMGKERAGAREGQGMPPPENLFSPPRLEIKRRQTRRTNCLGRSTPEPCGTAVGAVQ